MKMEKKIRAEDSDLDSSGVDALTGFEHCFQVDKIPANGREIYMLVNRWLDALIRNSRNMWSHYLPGDVEFTDEVEDLEHQLRDMLRKSKQKNMRDSLKHAFEAGRTFERLKVRWTDPIFLKERTRRRRICQISNGRKQKTIELYNSLREQHPRMKKLQLVKLIASNTGFSRTAVWDYLEEFSLRSKPPKKAK